MTDKMSSCINAYKLKKKKLHYGLHSQPMNYDVKWEQVLWSDGAIVIYN